MKARRHVVMFVRAPVVGQVKTRLAATIGAEAATSLYRAFVQDTLATIGAVEPASVSLWVAGRPTDEVFGWARELDATVMQQPPGDLSARLTEAFRHGLAQSDHVVATGSDAPTLPASHLDSVFDVLQDPDGVAIGPASDGGYFAIGAAGRPPKFGGVRWSTRHALRDTHAANTDRPVRLTAPWYDVDTPADLSLVRAHLGLVPAAAPHTRRAIEDL